MNAPAEPVVVQRRFLRVWSERLDQNRLAPPAILLGIPALAFAVRAIWLGSSGHAWAVGGDAPQYVALAQGLIHGCGFAYWLAGVCGKADAFRTPVYPAFLTLFGTHWLAAEAAQACFGALTCFVVSQFVWKRFGAASAGLAALIVAIDVPSVFVSKDLMADPFCQFTLTFGFLLYISGYLSFNSKWSSVPRITAGSILVGVSPLIRPAAIIALPALVVPPLLHRRCALRGQLLLAALGLALPALLTSLWAIRNYGSTGVATLSTSSAVNLMLAADWERASVGEGTSVAGFPRVSRLLTGAEQSDGATCPGVCRCNRLYDVAMCRLTANPPLANEMVAYALSVFLAHPLETLLLTIEGFIRLCCAPHIPGVPDIHAPTNHVPIDWHLKVSLVDLAIWLATVFQVLVLILVWVGVGRALYRTRFRGTFVDRTIVIWTILSVAVLLLLPPSLLLFNWQTRYRVLSIPFLATAAAIGWLERPQGESA